MTSPAMGWKKDGSIHVTWWRPRRGLAGRRIPVLAWRHRYDVISTLGCRGPRRRGEPARRGRALRRPRGVRPPQGARRGFGFRPACPPFRDRRSVRGQAAALDQSARGARAPRKRALGLGPADGRSRALLGRGPALV